MRAAASSMAERNAVEPPADLRDEVDVVVRELEGGTRQRRALDEEAHGLVLRRAARWHPGWR